MWFSSTIGLYSSIMSQERSIQFKNMSKMPNFKAAPAPLPPSKILYNLL